MKTTENQTPAAANAEQVAAIDSLFKALEFIKACGSVERARHWIQAASEVIKAQRSKA